MVSRKMLQTEQSKTQREKPGAWWGQRPNEEGDETLSEEKPEDGTTRLCVHEM